MSGILLSCASRWICLVRLAKEIMLFAKPLVLISLCIGGVSLAFAQTQPLTLADCQRLAEAAPSSLTLARAETQIAHAGVGIARAGFLPQSAFAGGYTYNSPRNGTGTFIALNGVREYQT